MMITRYSGIVTNLYFVQASGKSRWTLHPQSDETGRSCKVFNIICVHLQERCKLSHDLADPCDTFIIPEKEVNTNAQLKQNSTGHIVLFCTNGMPLVDFFLRVTPHEIIKLNAYHPSMHERSCGRRKSLWKSRILLILENIWGMTSCGIKFSSRFWCRILMWKIYTNRLFHNK